MSKPGRGLSVFGGSGASKPRTAPPKPGGAIQLSSKIGTVKEKTLEFSYTYWSSTRQRRICIFWFKEGIKDCLEEGPGQRIENSECSNDSFITINSCLILDENYDIDGIYTARAMAYDSVSQKYKFINDGKDFMTFPVKRNQEPAVPEKPVQRNITPAAAAQENDNDENDKFELASDTLLKRNDENQVTSFRASSVESRKTSSGGSSRGSTMANEPGHTDVNQVTSFGGSSVESRKTSSGGSSYGSVMTTEPDNTKRDGNQYLTTIDPKAMEQIATNVQEKLSPEMSKLQKEILSQSQDVINKVNKNVDAKVGSTLTSLQHNMAEEKKLSDETQAYLKKGIKDLQTNYQNIDTYLRDDREELQSTNRKLEDEKKQLQIKLQALYKTSDRDKKELHSQFDNERTTFTQQIHNLQQNILTLKDDNGKLNTNNVALQTNLHHYQKEIDKNDKKIKRLENNDHDHKKENENLRSVIKQKDEDKKNMEIQNETKIKDLRRELQEEKKESIKKQNEIKEVISSKERECGSLQREIERKNDENTKLERNIRKKDDNIRTLTSECNDLEMKIKDKEDRISNLRYECSEKDKELSNLQDVNRNMSSQLQESLEKCKSLEEKLNEPAITVITPLPIFMDDRLQPIIRGIMEEFQKQGVKMTFFPKDPSQIQPTDVVILPSIIASRVGSDIAATFNLAQLKSNVKVLMIVFNHLAPHNANIATPTKERLNDPSISARCHSIIDMVFWQGKVLDCQVNKDAAAKISKYSRKLIARNK